MSSQLADKINSAVSGAEASFHEAEKGDSSIKVNSTKILEVCKFLKEDEEINFHVLQTVSGVDFPEENELELNYIMASFYKNTELILKTRLPRDNPEVESVVCIWNAANFLERECFDMFGIKFSNHPDLRRILTPDDWEGFPLRKDYVVQEKYHDMVVNPPEKAFDYQTGMKQ